MKRPLVLVIINYNDAVTTSRLVKNVESYTSLAKILIVDNGSTDDSFHLLKALENKKVEVIRPAENKGFAAGLNYGAKKAIEEFEACDIIFSNADIIIQKNQNLARLQQVLQQEKIGMLGPVVSEHGTLNRGWKIPSPYQEVLANLPAVGKKFQHKYQHYEESRYQQPVTKVEAVSGCFFLMTSEVLEQVNFFDEATFLYYEENIMGKKLAAKNIPLAICNEVTIIHDHSVSIDKNVSYINKFKILKKSQYYFEKYYNQASKLALLLLSMTAKLTLLTLKIRVLFASHKGGKK